MQCVIKGEVVRREQVGIGPFRRTKTRTEPFQCTVQSGGEVVCPADGIEFGCAEIQDGYIIDGTVGGVKCIFDQFRFGSRRTAGTFLMLSIATLEVRGRIELCEPMPLVGRTPARKGYAA